MNKVLKKIRKPFISPIIRLLHFKLLGKQIFLNRYTKKIPVIHKISNIIESRVIIAQTEEIREKEYKQWVKKNYPSKKHLSLQKSRQLDFKIRPLISVLVPTYNTNPSFLEECIQSVIDQTYDNWQLCIADDASKDPEVVEIIKKYANEDKRIEFKIREANGHICKASNTALSFAKGEYISLLDHDDILWPNALYEVVKQINKNPSADFIYSDEDKIDKDGKDHIEPFFKPDWSPEFLRSVNYITHFSTLRTKLVKKIGGFRPGYEGAQDWDLFLRISRETDQIYHIPKVLYSWRKSETSTAQAPSAKNYAYVNQKKALQDDVKQRGMKAEIDWQIPLSMWRINYKLTKKHKVSIIIPTKNQYNFIKNCLDSIYQKTTYNNFEIIIVDTGSDDNQVWSLYEDFQKTNTNFKVIKWEKEFNFAAVCNFGAKFSNGDHYLFLNNDTTVITPSWVEDMLAYSQQKNIGAVGCKLYYPDGKLQHGGIILGVGGQNGTPGIAGHYFPAFKDNPPQDNAQMLYVGGTRNFTAVTAACVMVSKEKFDLVKGFDQKFKIAFNDVDFCLKLYDKGLRNVYLPHVQLFHYESISVGLPGSKQRDIGVFEKEIQMMIDKWGNLINNDPYYHPDFRRDLASARLKIS